MFVRIYTGTDGQSHFEKLDLDKGPVEWSKMQSATGAIFRAPLTANPWVVKFRPRCTVPGVPELSRHLGAPGRMSRLLLGRASAV